MSSQLCTVQVLLEPKKPVSFLECLHFKGYNVQLLMGCNLYLDIMSVKMRCPYFRFGIAAFHSIPISSI